MSEMGELGGAGMAFSKTEKWFKVVLETEMNGQVWRLLIRIERAEN